MSAGLGDVLPFAPTPIKRGSLVRGYTLSCDEPAKLIRDPLKKMGRLLCRNSNKTTLTSKLRSNGVYPSPLSEFDIAKKLLKLKARRNRCPWLDNANVPQVWNKFHVAVDYEQFWGLSHTIAPTKFYMDQHWDRDTNPQTFVFGSGGAACPRVGEPCVTTSAFRLELKVAWWPDPDNNCNGAFVTGTATLVDGGYVYLAGTPMIQVRGEQCFQWTGGAINFTYFWTMVGPYDGPLGLVRTLGATVFPGDGWPNMDADA